MKIYVELNTFCIIGLIVLGILLTVIAVDLFEDLVIGSIKNYIRKKKTEEHE